MLEKKSFVVSLIEFILFDVLKDDLLITSVSHSY